MPKYKIPAKHKQGNKASFIVNFSEIQSKKMIGLGLAVDWISSRGKQVKSDDAVEIDNRSMRALVDKLASMSIKKSKSKVRGQVLDAGQK